MFQKSRPFSRPNVLYSDYNDFDYPLPELYWSSSSSVLVSRHPLSSIEEIISSYCPHCLTRYMEEEAMNYQNRCPACFQCPKCSNVLMITPLPTDSTSQQKQVALSCTTCFYRSDCAGLVGSDKSEIDSLLMEKERQHIANFEFIRIQAQLQKLCGESELTDRPLPISSTLTPTPASPSIPTTSLLTHAITNSSLLLDLNQRILSGLNQPSLLSAALPPRLPLRSKRTLRCKKDVENSKMSILVQPKTFPLEGDSSLKIQRGKWWVKDSSAVHVVPRIVIKKLPDFQALLRGEEQYLCVEISNPRDTGVNIRIFPDDVNRRLTPSRYGTSGPKVAGDTHNGYIATCCCPEGVEITLGPMEDELLREDAAESSQGDVGALVARMIHLAANEQKKWLVAAADHLAAVAIPIQIDRSALLKARQPSDCSSSIESVESGSDSSGFSVELGLQMSIPECSQPIRIRAVM